MQYCPSSHEHVNKKTLSMIDAVLAGCMHQSQRSSFQMLNRNSFAIARRDYPATNFARARLAL